MKPGTYELHLHFAENYYGPEGAGGGGEGSRIMTVTVNGQLLLEFVPVTGYATVTAIEVVPE